LPDWGGFADCGGLPDWGGFADLGTCQPADETRRGSKNTQPSGHANGNGSFAPSLQRSSLSPFLVLCMT
jgi:hypothetical protein